MKHLGVVMVALTALMIVGAAPAGAQAAPSVVVSPATDLVDGQTVSVTATGFLAVSSSGGTFVPTAFECAPQFPPSAVFDFDTAINIVGPQLSQYCIQLGQFPVTQSGTTSRDATVSRAFTSSGGTAITCGVAPGDCLIVVAGVQPGAAALASMPISFATTPMEIDAGGRICAPETIEFEFDDVEAKSSGELTGEVEFEARDAKFKSSKILLFFTSGPVGVVISSGKYDGHSGYTSVALVLDNGEDPANPDLLAFYVDDSSGHVVLTSEMLQPVCKGDIRIHEDQDFFDN